MPQPYFRGQMPALTTRNDGSRVSHVNSSTSKTVSKWDYLCAEEYQGYEKKREKGQEKSKTKYSKATLKDNN